MGKGGQRPDSPVKVKGRRISTSLQDQHFPSKKRTYTLREVGQHCTESSCWIVINSKVFDVTKLIHNHPGGSNPITSVAGRDVTDIFHAFHPVEVGKYHLRKYHIGELAEENNDDFSDSYHTLHKELVAGGIFEDSPLWFLSEFVKVAIMLITAISIVLYAENIGGNQWAFPVRLLGAALLGISWQQISFLGHDCGHTAVTYNRRIDHLIGVLIGNFSGGVSIGWWKDSHYQHHVCTNSVSHDPDIQHPPFFAVSERFTHSESQNGIYSVYHKKNLNFSGLIPRFLITNQHLFAYPILFLARINLYVQSFSYLLGIGGFQNRNNNEFRRLELVAICSFFVWQFFLWRSLPSTFEALSCILVSHIVSGILHLQIVLSHFTVPTYDNVLYGNPSEGTPPSKIETWAGVQTTTTLNIECPAWMDWFHGGLHFQTEHHLFPKIPRHNLRKASAIIKAFAQKNELPYNSVGFLEANRRLVTHLRTIGYSVRELLMESIAG